MSVSLKWGFVGVGQGGCRIAESFYDLGYKETVFINTASVDLGGLSASDDLKLLIGGNGDGAGKDPSVAEAAADSSREEILSLLSKLEGCEQVFVCAGAGGGTGTGASIPVLELVKAALPNIPVGMIVSMPAIGELVSAATKANAKMLLSKCCDLLDSDEIKPLIVADNELIKNNVKPRSLRTRWIDGNASFSKILHRLNRLSAEPTMLISLDKADLRTLMFKSGTIFIGSRQIRHLEDRRQVEKQLEISFKNGTVLHSDTPIGESDCACVLTVPTSILDGDAKFFDLFADVVDSYLTNMPNSYIHRGIYEDESGTDVVATVLSIGEKSPRSKIMKRLG